MCSGCDTQERRVEAGPWLLWVHVPKWGGRQWGGAVGDYHILSGCKTFGTSQGGVQGGLEVLEHLPSLPLFKNSFPGREGALNTRAERGSQMSQASHIQP